MVKTARPLRNRVVERDFAVAASFDAVKRRVYEIVPPNRLAKRTKVAVVAHADGKPAIIAGCRVDTLRGEGVRPIFR